VDDARRLAGLAEMQAWGMPAQTARKVGGKLYELARVVEEARELGSTPRFVLEARALEFPYLLEKLPPVPPRPGPTADVCVSALRLVRATPTFDAALAQALLAPVRSELARRKREAGQYDFDDMLGLVDDSLRSPAGGALAEAMRDRWRYALIDEFQDTDQIQWSIFHRAFFARSSPRSVLCLVGDAKQSIYRFRGADVHTFLRAKAEVVAAGGQVVSLDKNQRATPSLVTAINAIFDPEAAMPLFAGDVEYTPVGCGRPDLSLVDGDGRAVAPVHAFRFHSGSGDAVPLPLLGDLIAREVRVITDPARPWRLNGVALAPNDVFVLTRTAREGRILGASLREAGIPHAFYKEDGLFKTDEAREICALLVAIDDPSDRARRLAAWLTPFFGLPLAALERARLVSTTHPLYARLQAWRALAEARDFERLFEEIVRESGIVRREIFFAEGERELTNYLHIFELLLEHARRTHGTLRDLVHALSGLIEGTRLPLDLEGSVQRLESDRRAVQIMTIHKAKGLEAAVVFAAGGFTPARSDEVRIYHDGPSRLAWVGPSGDAQVAARVKQEEREEEQRLMYVALTRAKGRLYLPCALEDGTGKGKRARGEAKPMGGPYDIVNRRIAELARDQPEWLAAEDVASVGGPKLILVGGANAAQEPPLAVLEESTTGAPYAALREQRAGAIVTSYTRMRKPGAEQPDEPRVEKAADVADEVPATTLRSSRTSGIFLHEVLERVPLESFAQCRDAASWRLRADVAALFDEVMAAHRIAPTQRGHAETIVWTAYTTPLRLPSGRRIAGLACAERVVREMDFVYPIPEAGYVRGSLDLAFEHEKMTYFVDWKSDSLRSFDPGALERHVQDHYAEQARLYSLAIVKLLGLDAREAFERRFGGLLFCFLRGMGEEGSGVWATCPTWNDVLDAESALRARRSWGAWRTK
jgi:exodeoxyribonuclease V beta subunit